MRSPNRATAALPNARPPMKVDRTMLVAHRLLPNTSPQRWNQTTSKISPAAPDAKKMAETTRSARATGDSGCIWKCRQTIHPGRTVEARPDRDAFGFEADRATMEGEERCVILLRWAGERAPHGRPFQTRILQRHLEPDLEHSSGQYVGRCLPQRPVGKVHVENRIRIERIVEIEQQLILLVAGSLERSCQPQIDLGITRAIERARGNQLHSSIGIRTCRQRTAEGLQDLRIRRNPGVVRRRDL